MPNAQFPLTVRAEDRHYVVVTAQGNFFAKTYTRLDADAIALAINNYDELVEALRHTLKQIEDCCPELTYTPKVIRAALTKAKVI